MTLNSAIRLKYTCLRFFFKLQIYYLQFNSSLNRCELLIKLHKLQGLHKAVAVCLLHCGNKVV